MTMPSMFKAFAAVMALWSSQAAALSGNELLEHASGDNFDKAVAVGFTIGAMDGAKVISGLAKESPDRLGLRAISCFPPGVTVGQAQSVVVKYLQDNPQRRHENAFALAFWAFADAWPCPAN
jgi:hypothetical protein